MGPERMVVFQPPVVHSVFLGKRCATLGRMTFSTGTYSASSNMESDSRVLETDSTLEEPLCPFPYNIYSVGRG